MCACIAKGIRLLSRWARCRLPRKLTDNLPTGLELPPLSVAGLLTLIAGLIH